jgi:hypothetical protein
MGAFCVFGVSKSLCRPRAEKKIPTVVGIGKDARHLSIEEWSHEVKIQAESLFLTEQKLAKISPEFDAPQFCRDWFSVAPSEVRMARIMVRAQKLDENGKPVMRKGAPVMVWADFDLGTLLLDREH